MMGLREDVMKMLIISMLGGEPDKYISDVKEILKLFDELDRYESLFRDYPPLYHPLEHRGLARSDKPGDKYIDVSQVSGETNDDYVVMPPIRGIKRLGRER